MALKRGKFCKYDDIKLDNGTVISCLKEGEDYKFMGVPQNSKINVNELGSELLKTVERRSHIIWSSQLTDINKCRANNQFVNAAVEYYFWATKFPINVIKEMDSIIRQNMNINGCKHTNQLNAINYLPRNKGGRGLKCLEDSYKISKIKLTIKMIEEDDHRLSIVKDFHKFHLDTNSYSIIKDSIKYASELSIDMNIVDGNLVIKEMQNGEI